jgi:hypothetical protein
MGKGMWDERQQRAETQADIRGGDELAMVAGRNDPKAVEAYLAKLPEGQREVTRRMLGEEELRDRLSQAGTAIDYNKAINRAGKMPNAPQGDALYAHMVNQLVPGGGQLALQKGQTTPTATPAPAPAPTAAPAPATPAPATPATATPATPPTPAPAAVAGAAGVGAAAGGAGAAAMRGAANVNAPPSQMEIVGAQQTIEDFLKEVDTKPEALTALNNPEAFKAYTAKLATLEKNVLQQTGIDQKTAAYHMDLISRARSLAGLAKAQEVGGVMPMEALVARMQKADANDPVVQKAWEAIQANPANKEPLAQLAQKFPEQVQQQGMFGAVQQAWGSMGATERIMTLGGASLAIAGLVHALSGGGGMMSAMMGGGGLLALLMGLGGGSPGGIMAGIQRIMGLFSGKGGPQRTQLQVPGQEPPPGGAVGLAGAVAANAVPGSPAAPAAGAPMTPEQKQQVKQQAMQALAAGDTGQIIKMINGSPEGPETFKALDKAFADGTSDGMISFGSGGMLEPEEVAKVRAAWPAIKKQMGG